MPSVDVETNGFKFATVITDDHVTRVGANQDVHVGLVPCVASEVCAFNLNVFLAAQLAPLHVQFRLESFFKIVVPNEVLEAVWTCD